MRAGLALLFASALAGAGAHASPFVPEHDGVVLERLPAREARELRALRERLAREPESFAAARDLAWHQIALGRSESDPRAFGRAEGVLEPWLARAEPPSEALLLRATLRQNRHDFAGALDDLARVLARDPRNARAWLTRALVLAVQGRPAEAERACRPLLRLASPLVALACLGHSGGLGGRGAASLALLRGALAAASAASPELRLFALRSRAELAARLGEEAEAETAFREALALAPRDPALLAARADFLLAAGRAREVPVLLGEPQADGLLLRLALAERELGAPTAARRAAELEARFAAERARGESLHAGEEARWLLARGGDAARALALARANFAVQREPADARVLLEAALAADEPAAARPVLEWLAKTGLEDRALAALVARIEALG